ncbi:MAG: helix-turn-helix transcriptional regulator [Rhizobiaceae bacterium]|nr:helix-turn-helix transcriptional regulator [Rhizobiaceae bacterium]
MSSFNTISHDLIDIWLQSDATTTPDSLCAGIMSRLSLRMALSVVTTEASDPYDWHFRRVRDFGFKSHQMDRMKRELPDAPLRDLDGSFVGDAIIPMYSRAVEAGRPTIDFVSTKLLGFRVGYDRLILPQKCDGKPGWCIGLIEGRFLTPPTREVKTDITDDNIIQLLIEGQTAKEIAALINLSPRTIEHRIDKLKERFEARSLVHLVAKLVAVQVGRMDHG